MQKPKPLRRSVIDLMTGCRLALSGGRSGLLRTGLTAIGVGLAVALLLVAASLPTVFEGRDARAAASRLPSQSVEGPASDETMLVLETGTRFKDVTVDGYLLQPEGDRPPVPPGLSGIPEPGTMAVSPALAEILDGKLLQPRVDFEIVEIIDDEGLAGPYSYRYYAGTDQLDPDFATRIDYIGEPVFMGSLPPALFLLALVAITVLLAPVVVFVGVAARFGGERRDRRLAALRLVGADRAMVGRIAAGESLLGAFAGLALGTLFFLVGRQFVDRFHIMELSVFSVDVSPDPVLAGIVCVTVPLVTVVISRLAMRRLMVEPLGVLRQVRPSRRRLWWRLPIPALGIGVLLWELRPSQVVRILGGAEVPLGIALLLGGVMALLPWAVDIVVRRLRGGTVSWQLAIRRLQMGGDGPARAAGGIAVVVAGAIILQMIFFGVGQNFSVDTGLDDQRPRVILETDVGVTGTEQMSTALERIDGVKGELSYQGVPGYDITEDDPDVMTVYRINVVDCETLSQLAVVSHCRDGDSFVVEGPYAQVPSPGQRLFVGDGQSIEWTVPTDVVTVEKRGDDTAGFDGGMVVTPSVFDEAMMASAVTVSWMRVDASKPEAMEHLRNVVETTDGWFNRVVGASVRDEQFDGLRRGILVGVIAVMVLVGLGLLVGMFEQLQDRRRLLSVLAAFGTKRSTMGWAVLWQVMVPVMLGLGLATAGGVGAGAVLQAISGVEPSVDVNNVVSMSLAALVVVIVVTVVSLPILWRLMRTDGLRTE